MRCLPPTPPLSPPCICARTGRPPTPSTRTAPPTALAALPDGGTLPAGTALHLGSLGLLLEPLASTLDGLIRRETGRQVVSLDPNVRPGLVTDRAACLQRFAEWAAFADVVKASDEDLAWLHPGESYEGVAERGLASGAGLVLITFGSRGAWADLARLLSYAVEFAADTCTRADAQPPYRYDGVTTPV
ncbi:hypothetical protein [Streptomyces afghaniensis]|uniref:hypothetical protein n=1 Tax=Streptomyces afghaniensis TaxID=66865 RepID=UPI0037B1768A